jgi:hypothetical protein
MAATISMKCGTPAVVTAPALAERSDEPSAQSL